MEERPHRYVRSRKLSKFKRRRLGDPETHLRDLMVRPSITKRDKDILISLYWHRCLTSHQIREMHFIGPSQADVICRRRLRRMFDELLVERFFVDVGEGNGSSPQHVLLDTLGAKIVAGLLNIPLSELKWSKDHNEAALPYLKHTTELNDYYVRLLKRAREQGHDIPTFVTEHHLLHSFKFRDDSFTFNPDAYFEYWKGEDGLSFFLEWDRGTMTRRQFQEKQKRYRAFYGSREYRKAGYEVMPDILTIVPDMARAERLREAIEAVDRTDLRWLFGTPEISIDDGLFIEAHKKAPTRLFE